MKIIDTYGASTSFLIPYPLSVFPDEIATRNALNSLINNNSSYNPSECLILSQSIKAEESKPDSDKPLLAAAKNSLIDKISELSADKPNDISTIAESLSAASSDASQLSNKAIVI